MAVASWTPALAQEPVVSQGDDGTTVVRPSDRATPETVELEFGPDSSLYDLVLFIAPLKQMNFVLDDVEALKQTKITVVANRSVDVNAAWAAFLSALEVSNYRLDITGDTARIVGVGGQTDSATAPRAEPASPIPHDSWVTQVVQLDNIPAEDLVDALSPLASADAKLTAFPLSNSLIVTDLPANVRAIVKAARAADAP